MVRADLVADLTGFEPATSALTGRRALQTAPQVLGFPTRRWPLGPTKGGPLTIGHHGLTAHGRPGCRSPAPGQSRLATTLMAMAMIIAPYRYDRRPWPRAIRRMGLAVRFVSETWKVMPIVKAR